MLDPIISLAFSMQSNKGVYALLLGSGVSRSSHIPTGWEVVLELVRKVARLQGEDCEPDPAAWYVGKFGKQPDHGELLDSVARTPDERQALLRSYFEPTDQEREDGAKMPTKAHRAIAKLVRAGYVRVIVTTNFDRLMERALEDEEGIAPIVVSGPDQLGGLAPFAHLGCCVVKVHGDYLDTRIRNTPTELATYAAEMNKFLDRVFDEFGLVVSGWSADWDTALRACIERAPSRRYSMYWAARGALGNSAQQLLTMRGGYAIPIHGADEFFDDLQTKIESIEEFSKPHPLSAAVAVASTKRFLSDPAYRIRLSDLIDDLGRNLANELRNGPFSDVSSQVTRESVTQRVKVYDSMASTLVSVAATCGRWGDVSAARHLRRALDRIYAFRQNGGLHVWLDYQGYPVTLIAYAALLGASLGDNLLAVAAIFEGEVRTLNRAIPLAEMLPPFRFLQDPQESGRLLEGMDRRHAPVNNWIQKTLWESLGRDFVSEAEFQQHFDWVEIVLALACRHSRGPGQMGDWFPPGAYGYRTTGRENVTARITSSLDDIGERSPYVLSGLFGDTTEECRASLVALNQFVPRLQWW